MHQWGLVYGVYQPCGSPDHVQDHVSHIYPPSSLFYSTFRLHSVYSSNRLICILVHKYFPNVYPSISLGTTWQFCRLLLCRPLSYLYLFPTWFTWILPPFNLFFIKVIYPFYAPMSVHPSERSPPLCLTSPASIPLSSTIVLTLPPTHHFYLVAAYIYSY